MDKHDCVTCVHCSNVASVSIFFYQPKFWITHRKKQIVILIFFSEEDEGETDSDEEEEMQTASTCKLVVNVHKPILI